MAEKSVLEFYTDDAKELAGALGINPDQPGLMVAFEECAGESILRAEGDLTGAKLTMYPESNMISLEEINKPERLFQLFILNGSAAERKAKGARPIFHGVAEWTGQAPLSPDQLDIVEYKKDDPFPDRMDAFVSDAINLVLEKL